LIVFVFGRSVSTMMGDHFGILLGKPGRCSPSGRLHVFHLVVGSELRLEDSGWDSLTCLLERLLCLSRPFYSNSRCSHPPFPPHPSTR
jgi:hypothetical protein